MVVLISKNILEFSQDELDGDIEVILKKIKNSPNNPWHYSELGDYFFKNNNFSKSFLFYRKALQMNPTFHGFYNKLGIIYQKLGDTQKSIFYYATAINLNPDDYWYYESLCQILIDNNLFAQAITYYTLALKLDQNLPKIYRKLAALYLKQGDKNQAISFYQKVIELDPKDFDYLQLGDLLIQQRETAKALACYKKSVEINNFFIKGHQKLGKILVESGNFDKGNHHYQKAKYLRNSSSNNNYLSWSEYNYLVDFNHKFVYCPIPKVACSSFKELILRINEPEKFTSIINSLSGVQFHTHIDHAYSLYQYNQDDISKILDGNNYFKFTFVRNPWNRLVSAYVNKFCSPKPRPVAIKVIEEIYANQNISADLNRSVTFRQFINYLVNTEDHLLDRHWRPQYLFLDKCKFDFVGKFETINEDFSFIKKHLNLNVDLEWLNKTVKTDAEYDASTYADFYPDELRDLDSIPVYQKFYNPELVELVAERYRTDIETFNYCFESNNA